MEPSASIAELRERVGCEALYLPMRGDGSAFAAARPTELSEPLDDLATVALLHPHATLLASARPFRPAMSSAMMPPPQQNRHVVGERARGGEWHITKNPTPLVTRAPSPRPPAPKPCIGIIGDGIELSAPATVVRYSRAGAEAAPPHRTVPRSISSNLRGRHGGTSSLVLRTVDLLGEDWDDLSNVEEVGDQTLSESGAWSLAGEIVENALVREREGVLTQGQDLLDEDVEERLRRWSARTSGQEFVSARRSTESEVVVRSSAALASSSVPPKDVEPAVPSYVFTWGDNSSGQCLAGNVGQHMWTPVHIPMRHTCISLCCGSRCSILITRRGTLWGGGLNLATLSEAAPPGPLHRPTYVDLAELENFDVAAVAAGLEHHLAVTNGGMLLSWASSNGEGQAGVGNELVRSTPVLPRTPCWPPEVLRASARIATVACGEAHSLALTEGGEIYAFGSNAWGQLGIGARPDRAPSPVLVGGKARGVPFRAVVAGARHSLALTVSGAVFAWGGNAEGCLGLGASGRGILTVNLPALVSGLPGPGRHIAAGGGHSAVVVRRGEVYLAGSNLCGQLGAPRAELSCSYEFRELSPKHQIFARSVTLGNEHTVLLTYTGELWAFGRNTAGQCGVGASSDDDGGGPFVETPSRIPLPMPVGCDSAKRMVVWAVAAGRDHNVVLCAPVLEATATRPSSRDGCICSSPGSSPSPTRLRAGLSQARPRAGPPAVVSGRRPATRRSTDQGFASERHGGGAHERLHSPGVERNHTFEWHPRSPRDLVASEQDAVEAEDEYRPRTRTGPSWVLFRPIVQPGAAPRTFTTLSVSRLVHLVMEATSGESQVHAQAELRRLLTQVFARPSMLNGCFCYPGLRRARLDAAGLCRILATICARFEGLAPSLLEAVSEGLSVLAKGPLEDVMQRDQLRAVAVYMCLPVHRTTHAVGARGSRLVLASIAHLVMRMSGQGRATLRDLIADECGDVRVLRDFLVPNARVLADDAIRNAGQQPWLAGPLWEVVSQLQLQRPLWESVLVLQVLASASEHAARLMRSDAGVPSSCVASHPSCDHELSDSSARSGAGDSGDSVASSSQMVSLGKAPVIGLLDQTAFHLVSLAEGYIPPEVEFWLFQEHAQFHQITPAEVVNEPWWSDAAGMLPRRFCSFMAHSNLAPIAFKQRVLQVENVLRQRLSQEQVLWPQANMVLGGGRADPAAFYFMLSVSRQDLLRDTFAQMYSASPVDLRRPLRVEFTGEEAVDEGGVMREFFRLLSRELFAPLAGLFFEVEDSRRLWFAPSLTRPRQLEDYWMVGVIVALAVYNNHPGLDAPLPSCLFRKLKEQPTTQDDLAQLFPSHARSLDAILTWKPSKPADTAAGLAAADREFNDLFCISYVLSAHQQAGCVSPAAEVPLCEGGADRPVLFSDREEFARLAHKYLLHGSVQPQFESFARGFQRVCNSPLFDVLSPEELEAIVAGDKDLDFKRLRLGAHYEGFSDTDPFVDDLWEILEAFSVQRRRRFLAFCTGSDVAPAGGLQDLRLLVQRNGEEPTMRLPVAHTCFSLLLLPRYGSKEKLRTMLITAIEWTEGFGLR